MTAPTPPPPSNPLDDISVAARGAMDKALEYLHDTVCMGRKANATPADAEHLALGILLTITYLEAFLKASVPADVRKNIRAAIEMFSHLSTKATNTGATVKKDLTDPATGTTMGPNAD